MKRYAWEGRQLILQVEEDVCGDVQDLLRSELFSSFVGMYCDNLRDHESPLVEPFLSHYQESGNWSEVIDLFRVLSETPLEQAARSIPNARVFLESPKRRLLHEFAEGLYDYWRSFDRYLVLRSEVRPGGYDQRPYRAFNTSVETIAHHVRGVYRDICENITGDHPRVYRQVPAGMNVGLIVARCHSSLPQMYAELLGGIPFIRQVWIDPPLIIDPPMNKRTGQFERVDENPVDGLDLDEDEWLLYPAMVGPLVVFVYFHRMFVGLGSALANLFVLASDEQIETGPDAVYLFGAPPEAMARFGDLPTVFHDDLENDLVVGAAPAEERFGYFGYLKKMILTLHNVVMMKRGRMPYHGAMFRIALRSGPSANVLLIGDTATGKSETLEAFRQLGGQSIRDIRIIADDMGSLEVAQGGGITAFGTEIGAFVRLDDLQPGYAFDQMDRAILMSPHRTNARVVLPVTTQEDILEGCRVDILLYANNYEQVDADHPVIERFPNAEQALDVFRKGAAMAKGTTSSTGLVRSYFANIFGPPQFRDTHERLAARVFEEAYSSGVFVGQIRTRLGIDGWETSGPLEGARALMELIQRE